MKKSVLESAYYQEWAFVQGRKFLLSILALGSVLVTHKIGSYIGNLIFPNLFIPQLVIQILFVALGWASIDWVLANALSSASNVDDVAGSKRPVWVFAIAALTSTLLLSISSNYFISGELAGKTHLTAFNSQVSRAMVQDSVLKSKAFNSLENATSDQNKLHTDALTEKDRLINQAVKKGSTSWKSDYKRHKNNPNGFFWKCRRCPQSYKDYRQSILDATEAGDKLVHEAKNHKKFIQSSLSPTLSYNLSTDSLLLAVKDNTLKLEAERKDKEAQLNIILLVMTLSCGILALILTYVLKEHRKKYGQQVIENNVKLLMLIFDMVQRFGNGLADILYTVTVQPFNYFQRKGWIKRYQLTDSRSNRYTDNYTNNPTFNGYNATVTDKPLSVERLCQNCQTDISHKRSDAKFCSDSCRLEHHNFIPNKKILEKS
ncbi:MAG: hypothetical protein AB8G86_04860 [Saprospiraceae bacterium]